jgi:hypothetical protein
MTRPQGMPTLVHGSFARRARDCGALPTAGARRRGGAP